MDVCIQMQQQLSKEGEAPTESGVGIQNTQMNSNDTTAAWAAMPSRRRLVFENDTTTFCSICIFLGSPAFGGHKPHAGNGCVWAGCFRAAVDATRTAWKRRFQWFSLKRIFVVTL